MVALMLISNNTCNNNINGMDNHSNGGGSCNKINKYCNNINTGGDGSITANT